MEWKNWILSIVWKHCAISSPIRRNVEFPKIMILGVTFLTHYLDILLLYILTTLLSYAFIHDFKYIRCSCYYFRGKETNHVYQYFGSFGLAYRIILWLSYPVNRIKKHNSNIKIINNWRNLKTIIRLLCNKNAIH